MLCGWCRYVEDWIYRNIWVWLWTRITIAWRQCTAQVCRWWCLCCNKWLCWIGLIVATILSAIVYVVAQLVGLVVCIVCKVVCFFVCLIPGLFGDRNCYPGCDSSSETSPINVAGRSVRSATVDTAAVIVTRSELAKATRWWRLLVRTTPLNVDLSGLGDEQDRILAPAIDRSCGCREGTIGMVLAAAIFGWSALRKPSPKRSKGLAAKVGAGVASAAVGAVLGKTVGVIRSDAEFRRLMQAL